MILELVESDVPKTLGEKISEYLSRPPQPVLRFYGGFSMEIANGKKHLLFAVRNGLPLPLLYGIYIKTDNEYIERTDHIGPFSVDDWRLTLDTISPAQIELRIGIVPFELMTDRAQIAV